MQTRRFHIQAGDIDGLILDCLSATVDGLQLGTSTINLIDGDQAKNYSSLFGESNKLFSFFPLLIQVLVTADAQMISVSTLSIGTNSPNFDNILSPTLLTGLTSTGKQSVFLPSPGSSVATYGSTVTAKITSIGIGSLLSLQVSVIGVFQPAL